jgi:hypothetical protein
MRNTLFKKYARKHSYWAHILPKKLLWENRKNEIDLRKKFLTGKIVENISGKTLKGKAFRESPYKSLKKEIFLWRLTRKNCHGNACLEKLQKALKRAFQKPLALREIITSKYLLDNLFKMLKT